MVTLPLEIVAASITLEFWPGSRSTNGAAWVTIFLVVIIAINFFGVRGYGEAEFVFSIIKVMAVIGFILLGIIINTGGIPGDDRGYIGAQYWYNPGAFVGKSRSHACYYLLTAHRTMGSKAYVPSSSQLRSPFRGLNWSVSLQRRRRIHVWLFQRP